MDAGHFGTYNMFPKFKAAVEFIEQKEGREALITSLEQLKAGLHGKAGTRIHG